MTDRPPSDGPTWVGPRGEEPSFPRRGRRLLLALALAAALAGLILLWVGATHTGGLAAAQVAAGAFATTIGAFGLFGARKARVCAGCGHAPRVRVARFPLAEADQLITAIELADPERIARIDAPAPGEPTLRLELLHCPHCRDLGWLRLMARIQGVPMRVGSTWVLLGSFLRDMLEEMTRRR